jgi:hypothetical protein
MLCAKTVDVKDARLIGRVPNISPDYSGVVIPPNIAPLNFTVKEKASRYYVEISSTNGTTIKINRKDPHVRIPAGEWAKLLSESAGKSITVTVFTGNEENEWRKFLPFVNTIASEKIDRYLVYRLLDHGYSYWQDIGIYERDMQNFNEKPVILNRTTGQGCINCHSFRMNDPDNMLLHLRAGKAGGTLVLHEGVLEKINTKAGDFKSAVYPYWHPSGEFISFSVNKILQCFHMTGRKRIEVFDFESDLIFYDVKTHTITSPEKTSYPDKMETYPAWSPDGRHLYFCRTHQPDNLLNNYEPYYDSIRYDLMRIAFDPEKKEWGKLDTILSSDSTGKSITFPRVSPDGNYLLFCMIDYGIFSIQHPESDLYMMNIATGEYQHLTINSDETDSYHSWSSNSKWIVFSSKRDDGVYARVYISYVDKHGKAYKPFMLPQKNPHFYHTFLKTYNIPELNKAKIKVSQWRLTRKAYTKAIESKFVPRN